MARSKSTFNNSKSKSSSNKKLRDNQVDLFNKLIKEQNILKSVVNVASMLSDSVFIKSLILEKLPLSNKDLINSDETMDSDIVMLIITTFFPINVIKNINDTKSEDTKANIIIKYLEGNSDIVNNIMYVILNYANKDMFMKLEGENEYTFIQNIMNNKYPIFNDKYDGVGDQNRYINRVTSKKSYYSKVLFREAYRYLVKAKVDIDRLLNTKKFPGELKTYEDDIIFLWKEMTASKEQYQMLKYFTDFNINIDSLMEWYDDNDLNYHELLGDNEKITYMFNSEINESLKDIHNATEYFRTKPREYFRRIMDIHKYDTDYRWIIDSNTLTNEHKDNLVKVLLYKIDKQHFKNVALTKFKRKFKENELKKQAKLKQLEFEKANLYFMKITIASMVVPKTKINVKDFITSHIPDVSVIHDKQEILYKQLFEKYSNALSSYTEDYDKIIRLYKIFQEYTQINTIPDSYIDNARNYFEYKSKGYIWNTTEKSVYQKLSLTYENNPIIVAIRLSILPRDEKTKYLYYYTYAIDNHLV